MKLRGEKLFRVATVKAGKQQKVNLTSHFFLRLPRKAESVHVHVCVCISHTYSLPYSSPENVVCVTACWQPYSHFHRLVKTAHHHMPNVYPELCVFLDACVLLYMCVREKGECVVFYSSDLISVSFFYCNADGKIVNVTLCAWCFFLPLFVFLCLCSTQIFSNISSPHKDLWKLLYTSKTNRVYVL